MTIILNAPTSEQVQSSLSFNDASRTILAEVVKHPFAAQVSRWDANDHGDLYGDPPRIEIDCSTQDGGDMFFDLTILPDYVETFAEVVNEIVSDYRAIVSRVKSLVRDESEIRVAAEIRESL